MSQGGAKSPKNKARKVLEERRRRGLTEAEIRAVEEYVSGDGMWINQYFRKNGEGFGDLSESEKEYVKDLDSATRGFVGEDTLYRSTDMSSIFSGIDLENLSIALMYGAGTNPKTDWATMKAYEQAQKVLGKTFTEKGYMSTTRDKKIAEDWGDFTGSDHPMVLIMHGTRGLHGVDASNISEQAKQAEKEDPQKETLLARNQQYIPRKMYAQNGVIYVEVDMVKKGK